MVLPRDYSVLAVPNSRFLGRRLALSRLKVLALEDMTPEAGSLSTMLPHHIPTIESLSFTQILLDFPVDRRDDRIIRITEPETPPRNNSAKDGGPDITEATAGVNEINKYLPLVLWPTIVDLCRDMPSLPEC